MAINIILPAVANLFQIAETQVYPDDRIDVEYRLPAIWHALTLDDPAEGILDAIRDRLEERGFPGWEPAPGSPLRVRDLIADVARHIQSAAGAGAIAKGRRRC